MVQAPAQPGKHSFQEELSGEVKKGSCPCPEKWGSPGSVVSASQESKRNKATLQTKYLSLGVASLEGETECLGAEGGSLEFFPESAAEGKLCLHFSQGKNLRIRVWSGVGFVERMS